MIGFDGLDFKFGATRRREFWACADRLAVACVSLHADGKLRMNTWFEFCKFSISRLDISYCAFANPSLISF